MFKDRKETRTALPKTLPRTNSVLHSRVSTGQLQTIFLILLPGILPLNDYCWNLPDSHHPHSPEVLLPCPCPPIKILLIPENSVQTIALHEFIPDYPNRKQGLSFEIQGESLVKHLSSSDEEYI